MQLTGKRVVVTGGSRGIGAEYVQGFLSQGAKVVNADVTPPSAASAHENLTFVRTDVSDESSVATLVEEACSQLGGIDVLVNNAALYADISVKCPFDEITATAWDRVMAVNVRGVWHCVSAVAPVMRQQNYGKIVNISSASVYIGSGGFAHYVASKAAVVGLTRALARELGPYGITVNSVAPGLVSNEGTRALNDNEYVARAAQSRAISREMTSEDLVGTVLFLSSPLSDFVSGQDFVVDGGHILK